jgi:excisionase family DNA binding protein
VTWLGSSFARSGRWTEPFDGGRPLPKLFRYRYSLNIESSLLSVEEAAAVIGVSGRRVRVFVAEGRLPAHRVGARVIAITRAAALAFAKERRTPGRPRLQRVDTAKRTQMVGP